MHQLSKKIGFIGSGNMGSAMISGILKSGLSSPEQIAVSDLSQTALNSLKEKYNIKIMTGNIETTIHADILILAVKPNIYRAVIKEIKDSIHENTVIVSIAAGQTLETLAGLLGTDKKIIRTMPNTPALIGEGMSALCPNENVGKEDLDDVLYIFNSFGKAEIVAEYLMDAVVAVSGASPAYVYLFIEAMADAAVAEGMPRAQSYRFAAQSVLGAARMVLETGEHPGKLKDDVTSPGGATIAGVSELEKQGLRSAVITAMKACSDKSRDMSRG